MKNAKFIILFLFFISSTNINAGNLFLTADKSEYLRYEIVHFYAEFKEAVPGRNSVLNFFRKQPKITENMKSSAVCTAKIFHKNRQIETVGGIKEVRLLYNPALDKWVGKWPIPWNPSTGPYSAAAALKINGKTFASNVSFKIKKRVPPKLPKGFCSMNIEPGSSIIRRVPGAGGKSVRIWENYILWAKFMGATTLWHNVGQSQLWHRLDSNVFPWDKTTLRQISDVAETCHENGLTYGGWITSYVALGNRLDLSPYKRTIGYDRNSGKLKELKYISIYDQKRQQDIINLLQKLENNPHVDYLGLDYMRTDFGGYEYAPEFIKDMPVYSIPAGWNTLEEKDKMLWLARKLEIEKNRELADMWNWWRAHKMSIIIREIKIKSGVTKPLWVFSLTWRQGKEHGQDPHMFIDAGVSINSAMFYSISKATYPLMLADWRSYLEKNPTALAAGQCVDWNLLGKTYFPPGPQEHFIRQQMAVDSFIDVNPNLGLFWHDLTRAFMRSPQGVYSPLEWAITGAASFSYLRARQGFFPFEVKWEAPDTAVLKKSFPVKITVKNTGPITANYYLRVLGLKNLGMYGSASRSFYLAPGTEKTFVFNLAALNRDERKKFMQMVGFMIQYGGMKTQERYFDFKYLMIRENQ
ncbi:MAG: hypothetical protein ACLFP1_08045 [Candidatus Goldiibacteriota bacterium]